MRVNGQVRWFNGAKSNLNATLAKRCVQQKDITSRLLRSRGVNAPENMVFSADRVSAAWEWGASMLPLVVKPPDGRLGELVHLDLQNFSEFSSAFEAVAKKSGSVLVEQWLPGVEHRVLVIDGKVVAAARRIPANVLGDGLTSVGD